MKKDLFKISLVLMLIFPAFESLGQVLDVWQPDQLKPNSSLNLGLSVYDRAKANYTLGIALGYERYVSPRLSVEANIFVKLINRDDFVDFQSTRYFSSGFTNQQYGNRASLSGAVNYYFKKYKRSGHYLSFEANNIVALTDRRQFSYDFNQNSVSTEKIDREIVRTLPVLGFYYGFRKDFNSGFFINAKAGLGYRLPPVTSFEPNKKTIFDLKISVGWRINIIR